MSNVKAFYGLYLQNFLTLGGFMALQMLSGRIRLLVYYDFREYRF